MSTFSERLRSVVQLRVAEGRYKSQAEVARALGFEEGRFGHWCTGRTEPDSGNVAKICDGLRTHPNYLFGYSDDPSPRYAEDVTKIAELERQVRNIKQFLGRTT